MTSSSSTSSSSTTEGQQQNRASSSSQLQLQPLPTLPTSANPPPSQPMFVSSSSGPAAATQPVSLPPPTFGGNNSSSNQNNNNNNNNEVSFSSTNSSSFQQHQHHNHHQHHQHGNVATTMMSMSSPAVSSGDDHRRDVEVLHQSMKGALDRTRQWYEAEITKRDDYIREVTTDFEHNLRAAQEQQNESDRLRLEVDELNRELKNSEATMKKLAETNGALTEQSARFQKELDDAQRRYDESAQRARTDQAASHRAAEAERARKDGEFTAREKAMEHAHQNEVAHLKQQQAEVEQIHSERVANMEKERAQLEDKLSSLERKLSATTADKNATAHSLVVARRREEDLELRLRDASKRVDDLEIDLSRVRDESLALCLERDAKRSEWESTIDTQGRSHVQKISQLSTENAHLRQSEKSLRELCDNLKEQLREERAIRRKESDEADLRVQQIKQQVLSAREAAADTASDTQKELHEERRKLMEELNDQVAETLKQTRRGDDLERKLQQATFEQTLSHQRVETLQQELSAQRDNFRADTVRIQQLHTEDSARWSEDTSKLKRNLAASEEARATLENIIADHVDREKRDALLLQDRAQLKSRVDELEAENEKVRKVVRDMTNELQNDPAISGAKDLSSRVVSLEAELARAKNHALELDVHLQTAESELREERQDAESRKQQFADTVRNLSNDAATLREMLQAERNRKHNFVDATLAGVSKWTVQAAGSTVNMSQPPGNPMFAHGSNNNNNNNAPSVRSSTESFNPGDNNMPMLEADAAASTLADRLDTQALHHELSRLELVVSTQQKQLQELISQRAGHVAQIADLKSMFEAVSQDRGQLVEINNALRQEARAAEAEVARLRGEIIGLRQNLVRTRSNQVADKVRSSSPSRQLQRKREMVSLEQAIMTSTAPAQLSSSSSENHQHHQQQRRPSSSGVGGGGNTNNTNNNNSNSKSRTSVSLSSQHHHHQQNGSTTLSGIYGKPLSSNVSNSNNNNTSNSAAFAPRVGGGGGVATPASATSVGSSNVNSAAAARVNRRGNNAVRNYADDM